MSPDTPERRPVEPSAGSLLQPLAGPVIWLVYFFVVYLATETACFSDWAGLEVWGLAAIDLVVLVVTVLAMVAIGIFARRSWLRWKHPTGTGRVEGQDRVLGLGGFLMGLLFAVATFAVGLPALLVPTC